MVRGPLFPCFFSNPAKYRVMQERETRAKLKKEKEEVSAFARFASLGFIFDFL